MGILTVPIIVLALVIFFIVYAVRLEEYDPKKSDTDWKQPKSEPEVLPKNGPESAEEPSRKKRRA